MKKEIEKRIKRIENVLIRFYPELKYDFCNHEIETINYQEEFTGQATGGIEYNPYCRCKKCLLILNKYGNPIIN